MLLENYLASWARRSTRIFNQQNVASHYAMVHTANCWLSFPYWLIVGLALLFLGALSAEPNLGNLYDCEVTSKRTILEIPSVKECIHQFPAANVSHFQATIRQYHPHIRRMSNSFIVLQIK